jgi:hypothetical protein
MDQVRSLEDVLREDGKKRLDRSSLLPSAGWEKVARSDG